MTLADLGSLRSRNNAFGLYVATRCISSYDILPLCPFKFLTRVRMALQRRDIYRVGHMLNITRNAGYQNIIASLQGPRGKRRRFGIHCRPRGTTWTTTKELRHFELTASAGARPVTQSRMRLGYKVAQQTQLRQAPLHRMSN